MINSTNNMFADIAGKDIKKEIKEYEKNSQIIEGENLYLVKESPQYKIINRNKNWEDNTIDEIKNGYRSIYIFGTISYQNLVSKKKGIYKYAVEFNVGSGIKWKFIYNDNFTQ